MSPARDGNNELHRVERSRGCHLKIGRDTVSSRAKTGGPHAGPGTERIGTAVARWPALVAARSVNRKVRARCADDAPSTLAPPPAKTETMWRSTFPFGMRMRTRVLRGSSWPQQLCARVLLCMYITWLRCAKAVSGPARPSAPAAVAGHMSRPPPCRMCWHYKSRARAGKKKSVLARACRFWCRTLECVCIADRSRVGRQLFLSCVPVVSQLRRSAMRVNYGATRLCAHR